MSEESQPAKPMTWAAVIQLILSYGLPVALDLASKWTSSSPVTVEEIEKLRELASQNARSVMVARLTAAGIAIDSPQATALLDLLPVMPTPLPGP
jgi:hypothetical protein